MPIITVYLSDELYEKVRWLSMKNGDTLGRTCAMLIETGWEAVNDDKMQMRKANQVH